MSDQPTVATPTTPAAPVPPAQTPDAGAVTTAAVTPAAETPAQPFKTFASQEELDKFMAKSKSQAGRKALNEQAKALGFEDWQDMEDSVAATRQPPAATPTPDAATPAPATPAGLPLGTDEASRLRMALKVGSDLNLPAALVGRLQGATVEEMTADAQSLLGLMTAPPRGPGIPPVPQQNQPVTFTRTQLQDPVFVREHQTEIMQAAREGRIVSS